MRPSPWKTKGWIVRQRRRAFSSSFARIFSVGESQAKDGRIQFWRKTPVSFSFFSLAVCYERSSSSFFFFFDIAFEIASKWREVRKAKHHHGRSVVLINRRTKRITTTLTNFNINEIINSEDDANELLLRSLESSFFPRRAPVFLEILISRRSPREKFIFPTQNASSRRRARKSFLDRSSQRRRSVLPRRASPRKANLWVIFEPIVVERRRRSKKNREFSSEISSQDNCLWLINIRVNILLLEVFSCLNRMNDHSFFCHKAIALFRFRIETVFDQCIICIGWKEKFVRLSQINSTLSIWWKYV